MSKNRMILNALESLDPAARENLLTWVEIRDLELRAQLISELEEKLLQGQPADLLALEGEPA